jgi:non-ribosomal peptide synthetase component E (peptide arylation enzyme)
LLHEKNFTPSLDNLRKALKIKGFSDLSAPKVSLAVDTFPLTPLGKINMPLLISQANVLLEKQQTKAAAGEEPEDDYPDGVI